ncbi:MAG TPA: phosphotransferase family protein [Actinomycetota bacterium]|nr:phosphotransferase family protein [Actinomycetota bacterium]
MPLDQNSAQPDIEAQLVDQESLAQYLNEHLGEGELSIQRHSAGHSNETFFLKKGGRDLVLRRPPLAVYLPTAHDVLREYRVLSALQSTKVRVPRTVLSCEDESVIGAPFYLMEKVEGPVLRSELPEELRTSRSEIGRELVNALAELHAVDYEQVGLGGLGKAAGYLERQIKRWTGQLDLATSITSTSREVPQMWEVRHWLAANVPESSRSTIVHGDYKLDNVVYGATSPARLVAILDWEMCTLGDPLADLGWMISFWREAGDQEDPVFQGLSSVTAAQGFSTRAELVQLYEELTGTQTESLTWYVVLAVWKLACLLEGSYGRHLLGTTDDPFFAQLEQGVPALARRALQVAEGGV